MENLAPTEEDGTTVLRLPLPAGVPAADDRGRGHRRGAAAVLLDSSLVPGGAVEIGGDERTGEQMAEAIGGRYEAVFPASYP